MKIEIDQSGHIEYTSHDTVIAFSNSKRKAILLPAKGKRELQKIFRLAGKPKVFIFQVFAILICLLLKNEKGIDQIIIDTEYPGREAEIKNYLLISADKLGVKIKADNIQFRRIGKKSEAHWHGYYVFKKERIPEIKAELKEIIRLLLP